MRHVTTQGLYNYWNTVRGDRLAPRRYEIEPSQIVPFLSETIIVEEPTGACRIRLAGTRVCETLGDNLRGQAFLDLWSGADQAVLSDSISTITLHGGVGLFSFSASFAEDLPAAEFELLLLPLIHLEERIERLLGSVALVETPEWLSTATPSQCTLTSSEIIWPEGRPHAFANRRQTSLQTREEVPVLRHQAGIRRARLVRSDRRSFLVYDGGRADTTSGEKG